MKDVYGQFTHEGGRRSQDEGGKTRKACRRPGLHGPRRQATRLGRRSRHASRLDQSAKRLSGLDPDKKVEVIVLPKPENPFEALFGGNMDAQREAKPASSPA